MKLLEYSKPCGGCDDFVKDYAFTRDPALTPKGAAVGAHAAEVTVVAQTAADQESGTRQGGGRGGSPRDTLRSCPSSHPEK